MKNKFFSTKKRILAIGLGTSLALAAGGVAFAFFEGTGSAQANAYVGTKTGWKVTPTFETPGQYLYPDSHPGAGPNIEKWHVVVTNDSGGGNQELDNLTYTLATNKGGCFASWFSIDSHAPNGTLTLHPNVDLGNNQSYSTTVTLELIDNHTNQDACQGAIPTLTISAS